MLTAELMLTMLPPAEGNSGHSGPRGEQSAEDVCVEVTMEVLGSDALERGDSTALAMRIGALPRVLVASPAYLERAGTPAAPKDLARHSVIAGPSRSGRSWFFTKDGKNVPVRIEGRVSINVNEVATAAAVAGLGIALMSLAACSREIHSGSLVRVLADWDMGLLELHAVFAAGRAAKPAARVFAAFLIAELDLSGV